MRASQPASRHAVQGLDALQLGHLRHFDNLSRHQPNQWALMNGKGYGQEDFGGYRFQLAYMAYALALTHKHRLPAAPGVFKPMFERLIAKMLLPEVWMYWRDVSRGGSVFNAHLASTYHEEWDPVVRDNIMYSAYVQSMALMYNYLFNDDRYAQPGALTFKYWSFFWGGAEKRFVYDQKSLNDRIYWQMVESGYLGVACEPNCVFQICNQPAILGFRMHDLVYGGAMADEVTHSYEQAWADFGRVGDNGHYNIMMSQDTKAVRQNVGKSPWVDAWCGALLNMWNRDFVHEHYPRQIRDLLKPGKDGALSINTSPRPLVMGQTIVSDDCDFGWVTAWASEMGDAQTLRGLLAHADRHMAPGWIDGGLYYPRNDELEDAEGNRTLIEPMSGNVLLGYARLNIPDGLWHFYNEPWDKEHFAQPALTRVAGDVDVSKAVFDATANRLDFTLRRRDRGPRDGAVLLGNVRSRGAWVLRCDGAEIAHGSGDALTLAGSADVGLEAGGIVLHCPAGQPHAFVMTFATV
jgi:linalool dehydratase/isomerase-like protein